MGTGWRRAFCNSISKHPETTTTTKNLGESHAQSLSPDNDSVSKSCSKSSLFSSNGSSGDSSSNPSTPRLPSEPSLRCRTKKCKSFPDSKAPAISEAATARTSSNSAASKWSPSLFQRRAFSNPSSPRSPSKFTLFKHFSRNRCKLCSQSLKTSQETAVFTAECSHAFHLPCISAHVRSHGKLVCPVCSVSWQHAPFLSAVNKPESSECPPANHQPSAADVENRNPNKKITVCSNGGRRNSGGGKLYDDDEPLLAASNSVQGGGMRFNPIPEAAEEDDYVEDECHGFLANDPSRTSARSEWPGNVEVSVMPEAVLVSAGRKHNNYVVAVKVKAPPLRSVPLLDPSSRAAIDLVMVLDVSVGMTGEKLQMLKRAMRLLISSLGVADRLSVVAFSSVAGAKRLLPLRRMSRHGQRSARQVVERLVVVSNAVAATGTGSQGASVGDALRKATKVLEDRRERNPVATIMLLSDAIQQQQGQLEQGEGSCRMGQDHHGMNSPLDTNPQPSQSTKVHNASPTVASTRFAHLEIPMDAPLESGAKATAIPQQFTRSDADVPAYEDAFSKCVGGLLSVVMQDVHLEFLFPTGETASVYRANGGIGHIALGGRTNLVRLGDLYAEEEKELLVELRVPAEQNNQLHHLTVKCSYKDPATQELVLCGEQPILLPPFSSTLASRSSLRLRNLFVWTRAVTESRRLAELSDYATAHHLLCSARSLLLQSISGGGGVSEPSELHHVQKLIRGLESEIGEMQLRRQQQNIHRASRPQQQQNEDLLSPTLHRRMGRTEAASSAAQGTGGGEALTPTSAWRAAEQLAKVAIMRKSLNRVSDLHGFENAGF